MATATPSTSTVETVLRATLATTCPARIEVAPTSIVRSRSIIPVVRSVVTLTAVPAAPKPAQSSSTPGTT